MRKTIPWVLLLLCVLAMPLHAKDDDRTLYERIGGDTVLRPLLSDFYDRLLADPLTRDRFTNTNVPRLKDQVLDFIGEATGGPQRYEGADMRSSHQKLRISPAEWTAAMQHLGESLDKFSIKPREREELVKAVQALRPDIVYEPEHVDAASMQNRPRAKSLFERAGGDVFLGQAFDDFWQGLLATPELSGCVAGLDQARVKTLTMQLVQQASGDLSLHDLPSLKQTLKVSADQWPQVRARFGQCLDKYYVNQSDRNDILDIISNGPPH